MREYWDRYRQGELLLGANYVPVSSALQQLAAHAEQDVYDVVDRGWVADPTTYKDFDPLVPLLFAAAMWTAAARFGQHPRGGARLHGNPTDAAGRALVHEKLWLPAIQRMEELCGVIGLDEMRARARAVLMQLAANTLAHDAVLLPRALPALLAQGQGPKRPRHRPKLTATARAAQYARAARRSDARPGHEAGAWFNLSVLSRFGLRNPRSGWTPELRVALEQLGIRTRRQRAGRRPWQLCVTRRESR